MPGMELTEIFLCSALSLSSVTCNECVRQEYILTFRANIEIIYCVHGAAGVVPKCLTALSWHTKLRIAK